MKRLTNEIIDLRLNGTKIKRIDNYINNRTKIKWQNLITNIKKEKYKCQ